MIRVLLVVETSVYRECLATQLALHPELEVVGSATCAAPAEVADSAPDVVLLDLATLERLSAVHAIAAAAPSTKVIAIAVPETEEHVVACAEAGVSGYVPREASLADMLSTVRSVARGEAPCSPRIGAFLLRRLALVGERGRGTATESPLTPRETEILRLIEVGMSNKEIAVALCIEVTTVKNHVHRILDKLHVRRRAQAAAHVRRSERDPQHYLT